MSVGAGCCCFLRCLLTALCRVAGLGSRRTLLVLDFGGCRQTALCPADYQTTCIGIVLAYVIAAISPTLEVANSALPAYVVSLLFFVGLLIRQEDMPGYWAW